MNRKNNAVSLKEAIDQLINTYRWKGKLNEVALRESWEDVVGAVIARKTTELRLKNKILYIRLSSPLLKQELSYSKSLLIEKINEKLQNHAIKEIEFL